MGTTMDRDAIDRIVELAETAHKIDVETAQPIISLPAGAQVIDLEKYLKAPVRMRRSFTTQRVDDFCKYVHEERGADNGVIFIAQNGQSAQAIIDYGTHALPQWGDHKAALQLEKTPEFIALEKVCEKNLTQRDLTNYLEDFAHIITPMIDDNATSMAAAIAAVRRVEINQKASATHTEGNFNAARTAMEEVEAKCGAGNLPSGLTLLCPLYHGTSRQSIQTRLSLITGEEKPAFRLRIVARDVLDKAVAEEVENLIRGYFTDAPLRIFTGTIK